MPQQEFRHTSSILIVLDDNDDNAKCTKFNDTFKFYEGSLEIKEFSSFSN